MEWIADIAVFAGKTILITGALVAIILVVAMVASRLRPPREQLEVDNLNDRYEAFSDAINEVTRDPKILKAERKAKAKEDKAAKGNGVEKPRIFVVDFDGDIRATQVEHLRGEITAILSSANKSDEVVVRLESSGGVVHGYGLAASQLLRVRQAGIKLTVCVDKVAASGGYMMACTADQLLAAPFAILGSIGVIAQVPNFNRILKKHDIDYEEITAGEFKRTISLLGEITEKGRKKFIEQIEDTHHLFKDFVHLQRPQLQLADVATGEYWFGQRALDLKLCDRLMSSDEYLFSRHKEAQILSIKLQWRQSLGEKIAENFAMIIERGMLRWWQKTYEQSLFNRS